MLLSIEAICHPGRLDRPRRDLAVNLRAHIWTVLTPSPNDRRGWIDRVGADVVLLDALDANPACSFQIAQLREQVPVIPRGAAAPVEVDLEREPRRRQVGEPSDQRAEFALGQELPADRFDMDDAIEAGNRQQLLE